MADRIKFHLDEHVDPDVARALRQHGVDVTTSADASLLGEPDAAHIAFVRTEKRVMVTGDADFLRFAVRERDHPGIVFCTSIGMAVGKIVHHLVLVYEVLSVEEMSGRVEYI